MRGGVQIFTSVTKRFSIWSGEWRIVFRDRPVLTKSTCSGRGNFYSWWAEERNKGFLPGQ